MVKIGHSSYESEFFLSVDSYVEHATQIHPRLDIIYVLQGSVHIEHGENEFDLHEDQFCIINPLELYRVDTKSDSHTLQLSFDSKMLGQNYPYISCKSDNKHYSEDIYESIRYSIATVFRLYYKDIENNRSIIFSNLYSILNTLSSFFATTRTADKAPKNGYESFEAILKYVHEHFGQDIYLNDLATNFYLSPGHISRLFQKHLKMTFSGYLREVRLDHVKEMLKDHDKSITEIAMDVGFGSANQLIDAFKKRYGVTPGKFRQMNSVSDTGSNYNNQIFEPLMRHAKETSKPILDTRPLEHNDIKIENPYTKAPFNPTCFNLVNIGWARDVILQPIQEQLRMCQEQIGFKYIRFHGTFDDDMMVYSENENGDPVFNFVYVDMVYDFIKSIDLIPYVELSYMPQALAADNKASFTKNSHLSLPKSLEKWTSLVKAFIEHCVDRYGIEYVEKWKFRIIEAYNIYYKRFTFDEYNEFYLQTYKTIKSISPLLEMGGPNLDLGMLSVNADLSFESFLRYYKENDCFPDFYTFQCFYSDYPDDWLDVLNKVLTHKSDPVALSADPNYLSNALKMLHRRIKALDPHDHPIILDTWNSTIWQRDLRNDTCFKSAFLFKNILENVENVEAFGYWVLSDLMEELRPQSDLYHGGYGLITRNGIPKAGFYAFCLLRKLGEFFSQRGNGYFVTSSANGEIQIALYNYCHYDNLSRQYIFLEGNHTDRYKMFQNDILREYNLELDLPQGEYTVQRFSIVRSGGHGSSYDFWVDTGAPENPTKEQIDYIKSCSVPKYTISSEVSSSSLKLHELLEPHEVCVITIKPE